MYQFDSGEKKRTFSIIKILKAKLERTYEAGRKRRQPYFDREGGLLLDAGKVGQEKHLTRRGSALGNFL